MITLLDISSVTHICYDYITTIQTSLYEQNKKKKKHAKRSEQKKNSPQQVSIGNESQCYNGATIYNSLKQAI